MTTLKVTQILSNYLTEVKLNCYFRKEPENKLRNIYYIIKMFFEINFNDKAYQIS